jgi:predicted lipoprotein with Yx(FWY)xxD motif
VARDQAVGEQHRQRRLSLLKALVFPGRAPDGPGTPRTGSPGGQEQLARNTASHPKEIGDVMRKSGWAAATGLGSLVLLLAACGGSSSPATAAGGASSQPSSSSGSAPAAGASSATAASTSSQGGSTATSTAKAKATPHKSVGPQPSGPADERSIPPVGTTVIIVQKSAIGYVMAEANHSVLYTYDRDKAGKPTCTGTCAETWLPATGMPQAGPADHFPGQFALVKRTDGTEQITYEGKPLYTLKGARPLLTTGNGQGGVWHVIKLSASNIG